jgi:cyclopropane fatty-acyl-phospholipid synthase-like methyltransferase
MIASYGDNLPIMKKLAMYAHQEHFCDQESSATFLELLQILNKYNINVHSKLLDLGCGNGGFTIQIAKHYGCFVHGIDISESMIHIAKEQPLDEELARKCTFEVSDFSDLKGVPAHFDFIIAIGSLYWTSNLMDVLKLWQKKMVLHGKLIIFTNMQYEPLTDHEQTSIEDTIFMPVHMVLSFLSKNQFRILEINDCTKQYLEWLNRWCDGMLCLKNEIYMNMGIERGEKFMTRFNMYLHLAQKRKIRRIILIASAGKE